MSNDSQQIVSKAWNFAHVLRDDGLSYMDLKQAFEGKLVSQDPADEPASVLMERIKAGQAVSDGNGKEKRPRSKRSLNR